jgi:Putative Actinobacterial Holin-X, holin superfamily III
VWGCFAIVGGCGLAAAIILFLFGKSRAESIHLVPPQTAETMQENVQWLKNPR